MDRATEQRFFSTEIFKSVEIFYLGKIWILDMLLIAMQKLGKSMCCGVLGAYRFAFSSPVGLFAKIRAKAFFNQGHFAKGACWPYFSAPLTSVRRANDLAQRIVNNLF
jgi:hypothetical protein